MENILEGFENGDVSYDDKLYMKKLEEQKN